MNGNWIPALPVRVTSIHRTLSQISFGQVEPEVPWGLAFGFRIAQYFVWMTGEPAGGWMFVSIVSSSSSRDAVWPRICLVLGAPPHPTLWPYVEHTTCRLCIFSKWKLSTKDKMKDAGVCLYVETCPSCRKNASSLTFLISSGRRD